MFKFRSLAQKCAYTVATAATKGGNTVATLFSQSGSTVAAPHDTLHWHFSRLKTPFNSRVSGSSVGSSPNFAQEIDTLREGDENPPVNDDLVPYVAENHDANTYGADEFDHEDFDEWWDAVESGEFDGHEEASNSWIQRAVDEAINEEQPGEYPPGEMGDLPW